MSTINASTIQRDVISVQVTMKNEDDIGNSTSFTNRTCINTSMVHFNNGGFTIDENGITVPSAGFYVIGASLYYRSEQANDTNDRTCPEMRFYNHTQDAVLTGGGSIAAMGYCRNLNSSGYSGSRFSSSMITQIVQLGVDKIKIQTRRSADSAQGVEIMQNSLMYMYKLQ